MSEINLGLDRSGNNNHWTVNNMTLAADQMLDSPTNSFATMNPLDSSSDWTISEGNTKCSKTAGGHAMWRSTMGVDSGKWYWEVLCTAVGGAAPYIGCQQSDDAANGWATWLGNSSSDFGWNSSGYTYDGGVGTSGNFTTYTAGDILGFAVDCSAATLKCYKNNVLAGTLSNLIANKIVIPAGTAYNSTPIQVVNFGSDSSFAGAETAQGETDSNGIGDFYYEPPTDFLALCTSNLPDATVIPSEHFNTALYTGTGSSQSISVGFQPDATWIKNKSHAYGSVMANAVVGSDKYLRPYDNVAETTDSETISSFDSDGFSVGTSLQSNNNTSSLVSWNWKAATTASGTTTGSGTGKSYSAQYNTDAGFSIISYEGNGTAGHEIPHHLSAALDFWVVKRRPDTDHWFVGHSKLASDYETDFLILSLNDAKADSDDYWDDTKPTSSVFTCGGTNDVNGDTVDYIAYCWHSVDGYSRVGSYKGNGLEDDEAPFVYTGFRPAWVMIKNSTASGSWFIFDTKQSTYNVIDDYLIADGGGVGATGSTEASIDSLANGFKVRQEDDNINDSGETFIYLAFAETPFRYANAR